MTKFFLIIFTAIGLITCSPDAEKEVTAVEEEQTDKNPDSPANKVQLKILNYNVRTEIPLMTKNPDAWVQKIVDAIVDFDPDIVGLVEVEEAIEGIENIPAEIEARLNKAGFDHYSHYEVRFDQVSYDGNLGMMLISKVPIKDYLGYRPQYIQNSQTRDKDLIQSFTYEKDDLAFRFFNYHPHPGPTAEESVQFLLDHVNSSTDLGLKFVSGDFNQRLDSPYMKEFLDLYRNTCDESNDKSCRYTYDRTLTNNNPPALGEAIDHIMINKDSPIEVKVVRIHSDHNANKEVPVSDHFPIYGTFEVLF